MGRRVPRQYLPAEDAACAPAASRAKDEEGVGAFKLQWGLP